MGWQGLIARQTPGYAIGGLAGGEDKDTFCRVVAQCTAALPPGKPRYVMGIGCVSHVHPQPVRCRTDDQGPAKPFAT